MADPIIERSKVLTAQYGVYIQPGIGTAYPELVDLLRTLYRNRVSKLAFLPSNWLSTVLAEMDQYGVVKLQQSMPHGVAIAGLPSWIDGDDKARAAWQAVAEIVDSAVNKYATQQVAAGRSILTLSNANAAFWNGLYTAAVAAGHLPGNIIGTLGDGVLSALKSFLARTWYIIAIVVVLAFLWYNRSAVLGAVNRKVKAKVGL